MNPANPVKTLLWATTLLLVFSLDVVAQNGVHSADALRSWIALDAPPGGEHVATDPIMKAMPGWKRDVLGNLVLRKGSGSPRRVVACGIDRPGFAVTEITDDGYLRLREAGAGRQHSLWVQFHEGQRIRVLTRAGVVVPGVVIVKSTHLQGGRVLNAPVATLNDLWVDVGAASKAEVKQLGIEMLNPVVRDVSAWSYGEFVVGPLAGMRVGCAAVASAAQGEVRSGETIFLITTLRSFGFDGFEAALRALGRVDEVTLVDASDSPGDGISQRLVEKPAYLPESTGLTSVTVLAPRVRFAGTLVESVNLSNAEKLLAAVAMVANVSNPSWVGTGPLTSIENIPPTVNLAGVAEVLKTLADVPAVSGHERPVREAIIAALPAWARPLTRTDNEGNLILEVGPDRDPLMFIAHQDEVGFEVTNIADDGTVSLRTRGGLFLSLWEGQPALLHFDSAGAAPLRGVFVPRDTAVNKQPEALTAWFGVDGAALKKLGVATGLSVTAYKQATRLGNNRFTARALDDRAGSTALILAVRRIQPANLKRKVIFSWSVREETGLEGAKELAKQYASKVKRVYSIDTFVSSDSPAETTRFAHAPLGEGAVIRGLDNSAVAPPAELDRVLNIARAQSIPIQVGATNGGTDGSDFVRYGVLHVSLSWPGRYSHSPVEVLDLRDLQALERLVYAIATAP
ncbi:MAG TPA: M20/M25/M40 family metallo-hydrolase [Pyrinomonadaceae bacterium]|nr:M20/M25/M40 family metallo-hydrolase [Pyrinomonadaceae bacterium]